MVLRIRDLVGKTVRIADNEGVFFLTFDKVFSRSANVTVLPGGEKAIVVFAQVGPYEDLEMYARSGVLRNAVDFIAEGVACFIAMSSGNSWTRISSATCL
jgi:hypothetical protein